MLLSTSPLTFANSEFLAADQAFQFSAESTSTDQVQLNWKILPHYYLYHDQFKISTSGQSVEFKLPKGEKKDDPTFGITEVHYNQVSTQIRLSPILIIKSLGKAVPKMVCVIPYSQKVLVLIKMA